LYFTQKVSRFQTSQSFASLTNWAPASFYYVYISHESSSQE
jgi:hypothetical protein